MKRKKKSTSVWSIIILILTVVIAILLPQFVFMVQDYNQMNIVHSDHRETFEVLATETSYLKDVNARMTHLSNIGYGDINISKIARSIDIEDFNRIITNVKAQAYMTYLEEMLPTTFNNTYVHLNATQLETCDCYIVYDDYNVGVILMFWYMVFDIPELGGSLELIVDSETETVYYVRLLLEPATDQNADWENSGVVMNGKDFYELKYIFGTQTIELLPAITAEVESVAENFPAYFSNYYSRYYGVYHIIGGVNLSHADSNLWENIAIGENTYTMAYALPYNGNGSQNTIFFRFHVEINEENGTDVSIGIPIIRQFVQS